MRRAIALLLALTLSSSGCATVHLPKPQVPVGTGSTDWGDVIKLRRHIVFVTLDDGTLRQGGVYQVTDTTLMLYEIGGKYTYPRGDIARVVDRVQIGTKGPRWVLGSVVGAAVLAGLAGLIVGAKNDDDALENLSAVVLGAGLGAAHAMGESGFRPIYEDRLIYVRP